MRNTAGLALATLILAGCAAASPASVPMERSSAPPTPTPSTSAKRQVGSSQESIDADSTVAVTALRLRTPFEGQVKPDRKGFVYAGLEVKLCVTRDDQPEPVAVSWAPWSLSYESGVVVQAASSYSPAWWDEPLYPQDHIVREGRCVRGWIPFEVRLGDGRPSVVAYQPGAGSPLEWTVAK